MAEISKIRAALESRAQTIGTNVQIKPHQDGTINPPALVLTPGASGTGTTKPAIDYTQAFGRGGALVHFTARMLVRFADEQSATSELDAYLSTDDDRSVPAALEAGHGPLYHDGVMVAHNVSVPTCTTYGLITWSSVDYLGAEWSVEIQAL